MSAYEIDYFRPTAMEIMRKPYHRILVPEEDGTWSGQILEFRGCLATGPTMEATLFALEEAALCWLCSADAHNQYIPSPRIKV